MPNMVSVILAVTIVAMTLIVGLTIMSSLISTDVPDTSLTEVPDPLAIPPPPDIFPLLVIMPLAIFGIIIIYFVIMFMSMSMSGPDEPEPDVSYPESGNNTSSRQTPEQNVPNHYQSYFNQMQSQYVNDISHDTPSTPPWAPEPKPRKPHNRWDELEI